MSGVVGVTQALFDVSKETARLEATAFELEQKTAFAAEAKSVLDSWVRYEAQLKQREQKELAESLIAKVKKELESQKVLNQILSQSVQDVESMILPLHTSPPLSPGISRFFAVWVESRTNILPTR